MLTPHKLLHFRIAEVCPIDGVSADDPRTGVVSIAFRPEATLAERAAAHQAVADFQALAPQQLQAELAQATRALLLQPLPAPLRTKAVAIADAIKSGTPLTADQVQDSLRILFRLFIG